MSHTEDSSDIEEELEDSSDIEEELEDSSDIEEERTISRLPKDKGIKIKPKLNGKAYEINKESLQEAFERLPQPCSPTNNPQNSGSESNNSLQYVSTQSEYIKTENFKKTRKLLAKVVEKLGDDIQ